MSEKRRFDIGFYVGPCSEKKLMRLVEAILDLPEFRAVHGGGICTVEVADDDPLFAVAELEQP